MLLRKLETMLHELYALEVGYAVNDFLITDPELARSPRFGRAPSRREAPDRRSRRRGRRRAVSRARAARSPRPPRSADEARRRQPRRFLVGARGRQPLHLLRVECRARQGRLAVRARAASRGRQVRDDGDAAARADGPRAERLARLAVRLADVGRRARRARARALPPRQPLRREILPAPRAGACRDDEAARELRHFYRLSQTSKLAHIDAA